ncbi:winged helix-turn-helix domain-containing protein [Streptomyces sp. NRRL F-5135]|uniref:winged helix-turn-helix domain-containing protein n=1 Tax=Streptomyces sp. NRRL F-5135 TaxID=1463858 RepID=UPI0004CAA546|nr:winged helix-turn-helix domain-containing protein [Streptomyces sp. NRRL F-5135]
MVNTRPFSAATASAASATATSVNQQETGAPGRRQRLRAVDRDETAPAPAPVPDPSAVPGGVPVGQVVDLLPPGATWLPAPQHTLPSLPGHPPMVGYLVLVPADQHAAVRAAAVQTTAVPYVTGPDSRAGGGAGTGPGGGAGPVRVDDTRRTAAVGDRQLDLTYLEFELLSHLVAHPHRVHTRDQLVTTVWGYGHVGDGRTVDVHVARLRRKLGAEHRHTIRTVRRVGYKYVP